MHEQSHMYIIYINNDTSVLIVGGLNLELLQVSSIDPFHPEASPVDVLQRSKEMSRP